MLYKRQPLKGEICCYMNISMLDMLAKMLVILGYQFSSLTSVMLLDCWTIPCVLLFSWVCFKTIYGFQKLVGVAICVAGLATVVFSDVHSVDVSSGSNPLMGDLVIIGGATLYGVCNVSEEVFEYQGDRVEFMAMLGICGAIFTAANIFTKEFDDFKFILSSPEMISLFIGFSLAMFLFYSGFPFLLKISGSPMLNLSLLTSNMWAVLIRIFVYHEKVDWIYFVGFAAVTLGLIVLSWGDEMDPNNGDEEVGLDNSNNGESKISFRGARNSLCYIPGIIKIQVGDAIEVP